MIGIDFLADTNFLIAVHEGKEFTKAFLEQTVAVSIITEIELMGFPKITEGEKRKLTSLLRSCEVIGLNPEVKDLAITLRQKQRVKVPDAIIAATSLFLGVPLVTSDTDFRNIKGIDIILLPAGG